MTKFTPEQWDGLFRRLNEGGCPVVPDHGYQVSPVGLTIEKFPTMSFSEVFELAEGGTGYAIELVLRNVVEHPIDIVGFQLKTPWGVPKISLVPAPIKSSERYPNYSFPGPGRYYDVDFVVNHIFARRKNRIFPGQEVEGVLVMSSEEPIPPAVPHNSRITVSLSIFDTRGNTFSGQFQVLANLSKRVAREKSGNTKRHESTGAPVRHSP